MAEPKYFYIAYSVEKTTSLGSFFGSMMSGPERITNFTTATTKDGSNLDLTYIHKYFVEQGLTNPIILGCCGLDKKEYDYFTALREEEDKKKREENEKLEQLLKRRKEND